MSATLAIAQVPGVNEGGFKLWEGAIDLCSYIVQKYKLTKDILTSSSARRPLQVSISLYVVRAGRCGLRLCCTKGPRQHAPTSCKIHPRFAIA